MRLLGWAAPFAVSLLILAVPAACGNLLTTAESSADASTDGTPVSAEEVDGSDHEASTDICSGHSYCLSFDEPDASVSSLELTLEPGGVGGSKCLRITVDADGFTTPYRESLYASVLRKGPTRRLATRCNVTIDSFGDGGGPSMGVFSVTDDLDGRTVFGNATTWRDVDGAIHLRVEVGGYGGSNMYCPVELVNPAPWTEVGFDVVWLGDGGATVDVATGTVTNHCTGLLKIPENVRLRPGITGFGGGKSPPSWQLRLDNFIVDVE